MKTGRLFIVVMLYFILFQFVHNCVYAQSPKFLFNFYASQGSLSSEQQKVLQDTVVQRLLLDITTKPRTEEYLESALRGKNVSPEKLLDLDLIRRDKIFFVINFFLFNSADSKKMRGITEEHAKILAGALLNRRAEIETIISEYNLAGVDPRAVLYIILGCFSLDWDGLAITADRELRTTPSFFQKLFPRTVIVGYEIPELSRKFFYKGSHNSIYGGIELTSFGDHELQPRHTLPDLLWGGLSSKDTLRQKINSLTSASSINETGEQAGLMMMALREGKNSLAELAKACGTNEERAKKIISLLTEIGYVAMKENLYTSLIPVMTQRDSSMVRRIRAIGRQELEKWCGAGYKKLHEGLLTLVPFRYGGKEPDFFYDLWHDIFGAANRIMVEAGMFADPYSEFYGARGVIPVVFDKSLYK